MEKHRIETVEIRFKTEEGKYIEGLNKMTVILKMGEDVDHVSFINPDTELKSSAKVDILLKPEKVDPFLDALNNILDLGWEIHEIALVDSNGEVALTELEFETIKKSKSLPDTVTALKKEEVHS